MLYFPKVTNPSESSEKIKLVRMSEERSRSLIRPTTHSSDEPDEQQQHCQIPIRAGGVPDEGGLVLPVVFDDVVGPIGLPDGVGRQELSENRLDVDHRSAIDRVQVRND